MARYGFRPTAPKAIGYRVARTYFDNRPFAVTDRRTEVLPDVYRTQREAIKARDALEWAKDEMSRPILPIYA